MSQKSLRGESAMNSNAIRISFLLNAEVRQRFDAIVQQLAEGTSPYSARKTALQLRKTRRLEPELVSRVADWRRKIEEFEIVNLLDLQQIPKRAGVYIFRDATGYLYIGQASDLRARLKQHLDQSDRESLAEYLKADSATSVRVELHIFEDGSPAEDLRVRRAYESELIRTRKPRFNLAP